MFSLRTWIFLSCAVTVLLFSSSFSSAQIINCSSDDMKRHYCSADTRGSVTLVKQRSESDCRQGYSWGYDSQGIWVDHGCRADFQLTPAAYGGGPSGQTIACSSDDMNRHYCPTDTRGGVTLVKQRSGSECRQGYSWGYDNGGIWVDRGCRADFQVGQGGYGGGQAYQTINCSSDDMQRHYCSADTRGGVTLAKQISGSECRQGYSWGYDNNGIWVDRGCRADFQVGQRGYGGGYGGQGYARISCSSDDGRRRYCPTDTRGNVTLAQQRSGSECRQGYSWGYDDRGIWVDHGCRADFVIEQSWGYHHELPSQTISCNSDDERRHVCPANVNGRVRLDQQRSGSPCQLGYSWGFDQSGIWVDHGCRANFVIEQGWDRDWGRDRDRDRGDEADQFLSCNSDDMHRHVCPADTRDGVRLIKQNSGSECRQGYSWGYDRKGIWVDHGCRADFQIIH